ncbi:hypothetical protein JQT66_04425 [Sulfitobacter mediterraneus]|uniref:hypothetical protein n=1 Tax=Sulfitobacter mediterraneus TaxID=83219 RepID=UPI0019312817|nr:hypothetical protein [Sulfitobacter mediterraneus]MBM1309073.1 hypothetical protein [Sulfitobacter mediterraneus]MBM1312957.1 hypothetical protein [Sulfitobacter mediterraneus]MBM1321341.1 hypothetical protein [Sulfitobacter mediterraneus]MBM1325228.1 hypothetical protein [Sulfitobacter mediterraneus]MBM1396575.1 hypothetical protein [Sulfitobacter mediterraneus]
MICDNSEQAMSVEIERAKSLLDEAMRQMSIDGGDLRFFSAALLVAATRLHIELEGPENLERTITKIGVRELKRTGAVATC